MNPDLDTLVTTLYVKVDDLLIAHPEWAPARPAAGIAPRLSDAELVTLAVLQALLGLGSEARFIRWATAHLGPWFRYLPQRPGYNKRLRRSGKLMRHVISALARDCPSYHDGVWLVDSTSVECGLAVSWGEPSVSGSSITRYRVQWKGPGESYGETREEIVDSAYLSSEITGLAGGNTYVVRVAAESDDGLGEWAEAEGALPSLPGAPRSVDVVERHRGLVVTWDEPPVGDSPITRYLVELVPPAESDMGVWEFGPDTRSLEINDLTNGNVYVVRVATASEDGLGEWGEAEATPHNDRPVRIAFASSRDGNRDLYVIDPDGQDLQSVVDTERDETARSWSPDRTWIAFDGRSSGDDWEVFVKNALTGEERQLTCNATNDWGASWSPDGTQIAFARGRPGDHDIWAIDVNSGEERRVTSGSSDDTFPSWSPTGSRVAFARGREGSRNIWAVDISTSNVLDWVS